MEQNKKKQVVVTQTLRWVLLINAISTGGFGLVLLFFGGFVGELTGIDSVLSIRLVGLGLVVFVMFVYWASTQKIMSANMLLAFALIDLIWVIDSAIMISYLPLTLIGIVGIVLVAILVGIFSLFEFYFYGKREMNPTF